MSLGGYNIWCGCKSRAYSCQLSQDPPADITAARYFFLFPRQWHMWFLCSSPGNIPKAANPLLEGEALGSNCSCVWFYCSAHMFRYTTFLRNNGLNHLCIKVKWCSSQSMSIANVWFKWHFIAFTKINISKKQMQFPLEKQLKQVGARGMQKTPHPHLFLGLDILD